VTSFQRTYKSSYLLTYLLTTARGVDTFCSVTSADSPHDIECLSGNCCVIGRYASVHGSGATRRLHQLCGRVFSED